MCACLYICTQVYVCFVLRVLMHSCSCICVRMHSCIHRICAFKYSLVWTCMCFSELSRTIVNNQVVVCFHGLRATCEHDGERRLERNNYEGLGNPCRLLCAMGHVYHLSSPTSLQMKNRKAYSILRPLQPSTSEVLCLGLVTGASAWARAALTTSGEARSGNSDG